MLDYIFILLSSKGDIVSEYETWRGCQWRGFNHSNKSFHSDALNLVDYESTFSEVELPHKLYNFNITDPMPTFGDAKPFNFGTNPLSFSIDSWSWKVDSKGIIHIYRLLKFNIWMSCMEEDQKHMEKFFFKLWCGILKVRRKVWHDPSKSCRFQSTWNISEFFPGINSLANFSWLPPLSVSHFPLNEIC